MKLSRATANPHIAAVSNRSVFEPRLNGVNPFSSPSNSSFLLHPPSGPIKIEIRVDVPLFKFLIGADFGDKVPIKILSSS